MDKNIRQISDYVNDPDFPLVVKRVAKQDAMDVHKHHFTELVIVVAGKGLHISGESKFELARREVFVIPALESHGYMDTKNLELYNILFEIDNLPLLFYDLKDVPGYHSLFTVAPSLKKHGNIKEPALLSEDDFKTVLENLFLLQKELSEEKPGWRIASVAVFYSLMLNLCRSIKIENVKNFFPMRSVNDVIHYMEINYMYPIKLDTLTKIAYMSESSLLRVFKKAFASTPMQVLTKIRLRKAIEMLKTTYFPISQIALDCGFYDSPHFCRTFHQYYNESPKKYRKKLINSFGSQD
jgi:AraC-like DNA-binding protein